MTNISIKTSKRLELIDITDRVAGCVAASGTSSGICTVFVPHTTASVTINENADPTVKRDILETLDRLVPRAGDYLHDEGNSQAHVLSSLVGTQISIPVDGGSLALGTWQGIYFCEFDGPRSRRAIVHITKG